MQLLNLSYGVHCLNTIFRSAYSHYGIKKVRIFIFGEKKGYKKDRFLV